MEVDAAAPPSASTRLGAPSPVDDDDGPAPERAVGDATPADEAAHGDEPDDVDMETDGNSETPPAQPGGTGPEDEVAAPPSASARSEAPFPVDQDKGPAAPGNAVEGATPADGADRGDELDDVDMESASLETDAAEMGDGGAAEGDAPPPAPRPSPGLDRAFEKAHLLKRLTTQADYVAEETMRHVYSVTAFLVQPGGSMAHLLIDTSVGCSVVLPKVIAALDGVAGLMADVRAVDADELLPFFVKAAMLDVMGGHTATGGTSPNAPSTH